MTSSSIIGSKEQILERDGHIKGLLTAPLSNPAFENTAMLDFLAPNRFYMRRFGCRSEWITLNKIRLVMIIVAAILVIVTVYLIATGAT
jgi:hypothetical protein